MNYDELEKRLRQIPLSQPDPEVKRQLLQQAARRLRTQRRSRLLRWALAGAAGLLIMINLVFGQVHAQRIAQLTGRPGIQRVVGGAAYADGLREREQMLSDILGPNGNS